jgi:hypothetical protein
MSNTNHEDKSEEIQNDLKNLLGKIYKEIEILEKSKTEMKLEQEEFFETKKKLEKVSSQTKSKIKLNVGGKIFTTSLSTLTMEKNTFFSSMFSEEFNTQPDEDGEYFIDRNPEHFHLILDYLRNPTKQVNLSEMTKKQVEDFYYEVDFYSIHSLMKIEIIPKFDILAIGKDLNSQKLSDSKFRITKSGVNGWNANVIFTPCKKWKITMIQSCNAVMCGVVDQNAVNINGSNYNTTGYFVYGANGTKYSCSGQNNSSYGQLFNGNSQTCIFTFENGNLSAVINNTSYGNAYSNLNLNLVPSFDVSTPNACFEVEFFE